MRVQTDRRAVSTENAGTEGMKGAHGHFTAGLLPDQARDSGAQLRCGLVRERDRQDLGLWHALAQEPGDAVGDHPCLAGPGASDDKERPVHGVDRIGLLFVEL